MSRLLSSAEALTFVQATNEDPCLNNTPCQVVVSVVAAYRLAGERGQSGKGEVGYSATQVGTHVVIIF